MYAAVPAAADASPTSSPAATSVAFLQLDNLKGDAADPAYPGAIDLSSIGPSTLLPPQTGKSGFGPFELTKGIDRATPALFEASLTAHEFKCGFIFLTRSSHHAYATFALSGVTISGFSDQGTVPAVPTETIELRYRVIVWRYQPLAADGTPQGPPVKGGWDIQANKAVAQ
jgi:type VI protein secretion system component Hcp